MKSNRILRTALIIVTLATTMINFSFIQQPIYLDARQPIEKRVEDLLSRMTLEEKLGQLNSPRPKEPWPEGYLRGTPHSRREPSQVDRISQLASEEKRIFPNRLRHPVNLPKGN